MVRTVHLCECERGMTLKVGYYDAATLLYEYAWAGSFHFSRFYKGESFAASLARHEHYLAAQMQLRPGMRVLDVGCGVGGPAREIARFADVNIVGLNNNEYQITRANKHTKYAGLQDQVTFVKGDFMKLSEQFGENSFDAGMSGSAKARGTSFANIPAQCTLSKLRFMHHHGRVSTRRLRKC
jgi:sterol 24-C-methyltransferase